MHVLYFLEDNAHTQFVPVLFRRLADEIGVDLIEKDYGPMGGAGPTIRGIRQLLVDIESNIELRPDAIVVGIDADCSVHGARREQVTRVCERGGYSGDVVVAEPEPHVESWYFADAEAFQRLLRVSGLPPAPSVHCRKDDYKDRLREAVRSGREPARLGGVEYGPELVAQMNIPRAAGRVRSLGRFVDEARACLTRYATRGRGGA